MAAAGRDGALASLFPSSPLILVGVNGGVGAGAGVGLGAGAHAGRNGRLVVCCDHQDHYDFTNGNIKWSYRYSAALSSASIPSQL